MVWRHSDSLISEIADPDASDHSEPHSDRCHAVGHRVSVNVKSALIFVHRWMGVCLCALFLLWFASGVAMMYWDYPEVSDAERFAHEGTLNAFQIRLSPQEAYSQLKIERPPGSVRVVLFDGRPVYRFRNGGVESVVYADTGETLRTCPPGLTLRIASAWTSQPAVSAKQDINTQEDQWTVSGQFRALRPLRKYSWPDGQQVYVSTVTCDVVQYTTRRSRLGAYLGPIPHWLYFTPLRRNAALWSRLVIGASGLATVAALLGLTIGLWMYSPSSKRYHRQESPSSIPYEGKKRWHMMLGLTFGSLACSWAFSGMLSMDPFPALQSGDSDVGNFQLSSALRTDSVPLEAFAARSPRQALLSLASDFHPKELELASFTGEAVYLATAAPAQTRIVPLVGQPFDEVDYHSVIEALQKAAKPHKIIETRLVTQYESYYLDRHHSLPLPVIFVQLNDAERSMYYVDPKTARIVQGYNSHSRWNRWLYHGLHSLNLPYLYEHRPVWDLLMLTLLLGGILLSVTALILAWRVLRRSLLVAM